MRDNFIRDRLTVTIASGGSTSSSFTLTQCDKYCIAAPSSLTGTVTLQMSLDGSNWRNLLNTALTMTSGQVLSASDLAPAAGFFHPSVIFRLSSSGTEAALRTFYIYGIK